LTIVPRRHELLLAAALTTAVAAEAIATRQSVRSTVATMIAASALALARSYPVPVAALVLILYAGVPDASDTVLSVVPYLVAVAVVGRFASLPATIAIIAGAALVLGLTDLDSSKSLRHVFQNLVYYALFTSVIAGAGQLLKFGEGRERRLAEVAQALDASVAERERVAIETERRRMARELHDVIAHALSVVGVHAAVAQLSLGRGELQQAQASLGRIEDAAEQAADDMRRLVGLLREPLESEPLPHLSQIGGLLDEAARAGLTIDAEIADSEDVPPGLGLNAFRIVQEALTNVGRHAPGSTVRLRVRRHPSALFIGIENGPPDPSAAPWPGGGTGNGVIGMRERTELYHGRLTAEPTADGGFKIEAELPLPESAAPTSSSSPPTT
jgi:signal transduction histidine kinase